MKNNQRIWVAETYESKEWTPQGHIAQGHSRRECSGQLKYWRQNNRNLVYRWRIVPYIREEKRSSK